MARTHKFIWVLFLIFNICIVNNGEVLAQSVDFEEVLKNSTPAWELNILLSTNNSKMRATLGVGNYYSDNIDVRDKQNTTGNSILYFSKSKGDGWLGEYSKYSDDVRPLIEVGTKKIWNLIAECNDSGATLEFSEFGSQLGYKISIVDNETGMEYELNNHRLTLNPKSLSGANRYRIIVENPKPLLPVTESKPSIVINTVAATDGGSIVRGKSGDIFDVLLFADLKGKFEGGQFNIKWDDTVLDLYDRENYRVLSYGDTISLNSSMDVLLSVYKSSALIALGNLQELPSGKVYLCTLSFKAKSATELKSTGINVDLMDKDLMMLEQFEGTIWKSEAVSVPLVFVGMNFSDTTPPLMTVESPCGEGVSNCVATSGTPVIRVRVTDPESWVSFETLEMYMDGKRISPQINRGTGEVAYTPPSPLPDKRYYMHIKARGLLSPWASKSWNFLIDTQPAKISISDLTGNFISPNNDGVKDNVSLKFGVSKSGTFSANVYSAWSQDVVIKTLLADTAKTQNSGLTPLAWDGRNNAGALVPDGSYIIRINGWNDANGIQSARDVSVIVDIAAPLISGTKPSGNTLDKLPAIEVLTKDTGFGLDFEQSRVALDGGVAVPFKNRYNNFFEGYDAFNYVPDASLSEGTHSVVAHIFDKAGNTADPAWTFHNEAPHLLSSFATPAVFNPNNSLGNSTSITASFDKNMTMEVNAFLNGQMKASVAFLPVVASVPKSFDWDGLWESDGLAHEGVYQIRFHGLYKGYAFSNLGSINTTVDMTAPHVALTSQTPAAPAFVRPGVGAAAVFSLSDNYDAAPEVAARVLNAQGAAVRTLTAAAAAGEYSVLWDGLVDDAQNPGQFVPPADGVYYIELSAEDDAHNTGSANARVTVDGTGPTLVASAPKPGADAGSFAPKLGVRISDSQSGPDVDSVAFTVDGTPWPNPPVWEGAYSEMYLSSAAVDPALGNPHTARVTASDNLGNASELDWTFNIDTTAPAKAVFAQPVEGAAVGALVLAAAEVADNKGGIGIARTELIAGDTTLTVGSPGPGVQFPPLDTTALGDGPHTLTLKTYDKLGNALETSINVMVDTVPPEFAGVAVAPRAGVSPSGNSGIKTITITPDITESSAYAWTVEIGTGDKSEDTFTALYTKTFNVAAGASPVAAPWTGVADDEQFLTESAYALYVTAVDAAGNQAVWQGEVAVDSQAPDPVALISPADGDVLNGDIAVQASASDNLAAGDALELDLVLTLADGGASRRFALEYDEADGSYKTNWTTDDPDDGIYTAAVEARDAAGNKTLSSPVEIVVANAPAAITNIRDAPDPFAPDTATGNSLNTSTEFSFKVTTSVPVAVQWRLLIGEDNSGVWTTHKTFSGAIEKQTGVRRHDVGPLAWADLKDDGATRLGDGIYAYRIEADTYSALGGTLLESAVYEAGTVTLDSTPPVVAAAGATPEWFAPDGYGSAPREATLSAQVTEANAYTAYCEVRDGATVLRVFEQPFAAGAQPAIIWDGRDTDGNVVPDGTYTVAFRLTDGAGNTSATVTGTVEKDNPPAITMQPDPDAFSPNGDGSKDTTALAWSTDQAGVFTIKVLKDGAAVAVHESNAAHAAGAYTVDWSGPVVADPAEMIAMQGIYTIEITGIDAGRADNECVPKLGSTLLDVEAPVVSPFYPEMHDFTWEKPKLKVNITDNLAGLGVESADAQAAVAFAVTGYAGTLDTDVREPYDALAVRAETRPAAGLDHGPHFLSVEATDRAGNTGRFAVTDPVTGAAGLSALRFVAIAPLQDAFNDSTLSEWVRVPVRGGNASISAGAGSLVINHVNTEEDGDGAAPMDIYGYSLVGRGVYDVSRQEVMVNLDGVTETGGGDLHAAGVALMETTSDGGFPRRLYMMRVNDQILAFYEDVVRDSVAWLASVDVPAGEPVDLKIGYEEGRATLSAQPAAGSSFNGFTRTVNINMHYATVGVTALSGFMGAGGSSSRLEAGNFWSDLASPRITSADIENSANPAAAFVLFNEESYILRALGTPWQMPGYVTGHAYNTDPGRIGKVGNVGVALDKLTMQGPVPMTETFEGSGVYESAPILADTDTDAQGYETGSLAPFAANEWFDMLALEKADYAAYVAAEQNYLALKTNAVSAVALSNTDVPAGLAYAYILPGEKWNIQAVTRPGDWALRAYVYNTATLYNASLPPAQRLSRAVVAGPIPMVRISDTEYVLEGMLDTNQDVSGADITSLVARVVYGPAWQEQNYTSNVLAMGEPAVRYAVMANATRPGADDVLARENINVTARARSGQTLTGYLLNPDNDPSAWLVAGPFTLVETAPGSGEYAVSGGVALTRDFDKGGATLARVQAVLVNPDAPTQPVYSMNKLSVLPGDTTPPAAPADAVVSAVPAAAQPGGTVSTTVTWTAPETDAVGAALADLAGYDVYRVQMLAAAGDMSVAAGSPALEAADAGGGAMTLAPAFVESNGTVYDDAQLNGTSAGWYAPGTRNPQSLADPVVVAPDRDITVCAVTLNLTGTLLFPGGTAHATVYSQQPRFALEQWIAQLIEWGAATDGSVDACTTAYRSQGGVVQPALPLETQPYYRYEKITTEPVSDVAFTDTYDFSGAVWSYAASAVDTAGNRSVPSVTASIPASSMLVTDAQLSNAPGDLPTGYVQPGEDVLVDVTFIPQVDPLAMGMQFRLVNKTALAAGAPLSQTLVGGPMAVQADPQIPGRYTAAQTLSTITDAVGRTAAELALVMSLPGWENITGARGLKGGVAPVRSVTLANAARPGKTNVRVGEPVTVTAQGNSGLALSAALLDPANGGSLDQPPLSLTEIPAGSGNYEGQALLTGNIGGGGEPVEEIIAMISGALDRVDPRVPSGNSLDLLPALNLSGAVSAQPAWLLPGWSLNSLASLANNGTEQLANANVTVSLKSDDGQAAYAVTQTHTLAPGGSLPDLAFTHGLVFLAPGAYSASLDVDVDGFIQTVAQTQIVIVPDLVDGTLSLNRSNYLSGESMAVTLTANNVSGRTLDALVLELRLDDEAGQALATVPAGTLTSWPSGGVHTAVVDVPVPSGITERAYYRLALVAVLNSNEDPAAEKLVPVLPEQLLVSGMPIPDHVIQYQEPLFNFSVTNQTRTAIADGLVTGEVHTVGWQPGEAPLATFSAAMQNLAVRDSLTLTSNISPVGAVPGEYRIVIFTQTEDGAPRVKAMETPLWVESCEP